MGVNPVAAAVGLNYESLSQRVARGGAQAARAPQGGFVELTATRSLAPPVSAGLVVELSDAQGVRLTVRLAAGTALDVVRLVEAFQRRQA
jgi:hypothetical protein